MSKEVPYNPFNVHNRSPPMKKSPPRENTKKEAKPKSPPKKEINWNALERLDLDEFDKEVQTIKTQNGLKSSEEQRVKKLRRRVQNRWSSKCCREKKKGKFIEIQEELTKYQQKCSALEQENRRLKQIVEQSSLSADSASSCKLENQ